MRLRLASQLLAALPLSAVMPMGMTADGVPILGNSTQPAVVAPVVPAAQRNVAPVAQPCPPAKDPSYMTPMGLSDKVTDAAIESFMFNPSAGGNTTAAEKFSPKDDRMGKASSTPDIMPDDELKRLQGAKNAAPVGDDLAGAAANKGVIGSGVSLKAIQHVSEVNASIERFYQEYRSMANEGKVNAATRDLFAKEKIGPRLDAIYITEINWLGKEPDRQRRAGQVQARVKLAEIEYEAALNNAQLEADRLVTSQWKYKHESKDRSYEPLTREAALKAVQETLKRSYESSPEYLEGVRAKQPQPEPKKVETKGSQNLTDCLQGKEASVEVLRRGASSGTALFQDAINQAHLPKKDQAATNGARVAAERTQVTPQTTAAATRDDSASETAEVVRGALSILGAVLDAKAARAGARAGASGSGPGASTSGCKGGNSADGKVCVAN